MSATRAVQSTGRRCTHFLRHQVYYSRPYSTLLSNTTSLLRNVHNGAEVYLVGTAHVSKASADEVQQVISAVRPGTVMVELDAERAQRLRAGQSWLDQVLKGGFPSLSGPGALVGLGIGAMYELLKLFGMEPGLEFKVAIEQAEAANAKLVYGDQDAKQTMLRLQQSLDMGKVMRMLMSNPDMSSLNLEQIGNMTDLVEAMKTRAAVRQLTQQLRKVVPEAMEALLDDRDEHMARVLLKQTGQVVGVVGLAHMDGIERRWEAAMQSMRLH